MSATNSPARSPSPIRCRWSSRPPRPASRYRPVQSLPAISSLRVSPAKFTLTGRRVKGRCVGATRANRNDPRCTLPVALRVSYTLSTPAAVTFTIERTARGRLVKGLCPAAHPGQTPPPPWLHPCGGPRGDGLTRTARKAVANTFLSSHPDATGRLKLTPGSYLLLATPTVARRSATSGAPPSGSCADAHAERLDASPARV